MDDHSFLDALIRRWRRGIPLSEDDKKALAALPWVRRVVERDCFLLREGEPTLVCNLLVDGMAFRQKMVADGARQIISLHIPGEFIDLENVLLEAADHNVQCLTRCVVATVPKESLAELVEKRPRIRHAVWLDNLLDASVFREWVVNLGRRDARERIAHLLCEIAARLRASNPGGDGSNYNFPLTQEQVADCTGLTAVHTNRTLQSLRRDGLISLSSNRLTILDWEKLAAVGDFDQRYLHHAV